MTFDKRLERLRDAMLLVTSDLSLHAVLQHITRSACEMVAARYAALGVIGSDGLLSDFLYTGVDEETVRLIGHLPRGYGILGKLISDPRPLRLPDLAQDGDSVGFPDHHPVMSTFLGVPIRVGTEVYGNLYLTERIDGEPFSLEDEEMVVALAAVAGSAIENARGQDQRSTLAVVEERERIGRELHDTVMQRIFAVGLELQVVAGRLPAAQFELGARLEKAVDDLDDTIREIRTTIFSLHDHDTGTPAAGVSGAQLERRFSDVVAEASRPLGFAASQSCRLDYDGMITSELAGHVLSATREGLANVARHAHATTCEVELEVRENIVLTIVDNGIGLGDRPAQPGYGLRNLQQRADAMGGSSQLVEQPGGGSRLVWRAPIQLPA